MDSGFVVLMGIGTVFVCLICIIIIIKIMSCIMSAFPTKKEKNESSSVSACAQAVISNAQTAPLNGSSDIPNKGPFVAAISAALAEELGEDVSRIRILSITKM